MILVDLSQVFFSNLHVHVAQNGIVEEDLLRHMILNSLRSYRTKFHGKYGELVICCDGQGSWRREIYPQYKENRRMGKESQTPEEKELWGYIFECFTRLKKEIKENFPYRFIEVDKAEGDDAIASVIWHEADPVMGFMQEKTLIISGDKDFKQLQIIGNVDQYGPVQKKLIKEPKPMNYLIEHIIRGDGGDGVPNVLSADDTFVDPTKRQTRMTKGRYEACEEMMNLAPTESLDRPDEYKRNIKMIDLRQIPAEIQKKCVEAYQTDPPKRNHSKMLTYFIKNKLKNLVESIQDF